MEMGNLGTNLTSFRRKYLTSRSATTAALASALLAVTPACSVGGDQSLSTVNDELRAKNQSLEKQVATLERERDELKIKLAESAMAPKGSLSQEVLDALPRVVKIELDSLSGIEAQEGKKRAVFYIEPTDGRGRFVQAVGTLTVDATYLPSQQAGVSPRTLGAATLTPGQLRDAYRANFTGTHYTVELPLSDDTPPTGDITLRVRFVDALTGQTHSSHAVKPLR